MTASSLTASQTRLWSLDRHDATHPAYSIAQWYRWRGPLDHTALEASVHTLIERHSVLRTAFVAIHDQPSQHALPSARLSVDYASVSATPPDTREAQARALASAAARLPFDLARAPLLRVQVLELTPEEHALLLCAPQIVADAAALTLLAQELAALYAARQRGRAPMLFPPTDYAAWIQAQRTWRAGPECAQQLEYWTRQLAQCPPVLSLPSDHPRPPVQSLNGRHAHLALGAALTTALHTLSRTVQVPLPALLLAAFKTRLFLESAQRDLVVGVPVTGRPDLETASLIGPCASHVVVRTVLDPHQPFSAYARQVDEALRAALAHQALPLETLIEALPIADTPRHAPLFQIEFAYESAPAPLGVLPGITLTPAYPRLDLHATRTDLALALTELGHGLVATLEYNTDLFEAARAERWLTEWRDLLAAHVSPP